MFLISVCASILVMGTCVEYTPFDGWYNNYAHPDWGAAETHLLRQVAPAYSDGSYEPAGLLDRPLATNVSRIVFSGPTGFPSHRGRTAFLVFLGQQIVEEVMDAQRPGCPPEYFNIAIPEQHENYNNASDAVNVMPFVRSRFDQRTGTSPSNPRQQINEVSSFIDGTLVYGPNKAWSDALRAFKDGLLAISPEKGPEPYFGEFPLNNTVRLPFANPPPPANHPKLKPISRLTRIGNPRGNENPALLTMGILWFRYHNVWARRLKSLHPDWNDERLFNEARKMVIAVYQKITVEDWLPVWLSNDTKGVLPPYEGYKPWVHPGIAHAFQSSAMRYGHTMVTPGIYRRNKTCTFRPTSARTGAPDRQAIRTCNSYFNSQDAVHETDIDELVMGLASQIAEREDRIVTPDLRGDVFGPLEFNRRDLMAINIQRGRDNGVADFNTVRRAYGLEAKTWDDIHSDPDVVKVIKVIRPMYNDDISKLDLWVGGMLETNMEPGETFQAIIRDQFRRLRDGDRFWYENKHNGLFSEAEVAEIKNITMKHIIMATTTIQDKDIQDNVFLIYGAPCIGPQLNHTALEPCTPRSTFDYFTGSEDNYIISIFIIFTPIFAFIGILLCIARRHERAVSHMQAESRQLNRRTMDNSDKYSVAEWQGPSMKWHNITITLSASNKHINIHDGTNKLLRSIDINAIYRNGTTSLDIYLSQDKSMDMLVLRIPNEYDLVLRFDSVNERQTFQDDLKLFLDKKPSLTAPQGVSTKSLYILAITKESRNRYLEKFFKAVFANVVTNDAEYFRGHVTGGLDTLHSELTKHEFSEALGLRSSSTFVESMFRMVDKDNTQTVSFKEFVDLMVIFYKGNADDKLQMLFNMYDLDKTGTLSREEFSTMFKSLVELSSTAVADDQIDMLVRSLCEKAGISKKNELTFDDFRKVLKDYQQDLNVAVIDLSMEGVRMPETMKRENGISRAKKSLRSAYPVNKTNRMSMIPDAAIRTFQKQFPTTAIERKMNVFKHLIEKYKLHIFWVTLYTLVVIGIFVERAYYFSYEREHGGLRQIAGDGVTVTRGAASAMMFTYSSLLVTMCRNTLTFLRETFLSRYIPFDAMVDFHKYIALLALIFTVIHVIGHCINFYHIATQTASDLSCLFRDFFYATNILPKLHNWLWMTLTGFTGVLLVVHASLIYTFAVQYARRHSFRSFWITHNSFYVFFFIMILHGMGRLVQAPFLFYFLLGPAILFTIDKLISVSRKCSEISVVKAELLPSGVTYLEFKKPYNFDYKSGQWVRIACPKQGTSEYHPFTLSSAPHEENLSVHIRALGPWTFKLRSTYNPENLKGQPIPKILLDGPFGEGHQDWYKFEVSVLVGGGIGVAPFISILKDIAHRSKKKGAIICKKVYFIWITRTQKQFEWVTDVIREVEDADCNNLVDVHIFITEFKQRFDIRTTMLYICERYFQKVSGRSLFTGLQSITHFGYPDVPSLFEQLCIQHNNTALFGVFSCGPPPMTNAVENACRKINNSGSNTLFVHRYENF